MNDRSKQPLISVVVLSMNKTEDILGCIESIKRLNYHNINIVIVDNGSTDDTPDIIAKAHPDIYLVRNAKNRGICTARNQGWRYALKHFSPEYVRALDNDTILDPDYLTHLLHGMDEDSSIGLVLGKAYCRYPSTRLASAGMAVNFWTGVIKDRGFGAVDRGQYDQREYVDGAPGFGNLIRMKALETTTGWDEAYDPYGWDDTAFCLSLRRAGYRLFYVPEAKIYHSGTQISRPPVSACHRGPGYPGGGRIRGRVR